MNWANWKTCDLDSSIGEAKTPDGTAIFAQSDGTLTVHQEMRAPLDAFANTVNYFSSQCGGTGYGTLETIGHGGGQRSERGCKSGNSFHCEANAIDVFWLEWSGGVVSRPCNGAAEAASSTAAHRRLVAVEAGLRKSFGYVLARSISKHHNHFHADNGCPIALRLKSDTSAEGSAKGIYTSCHYFVQDCVRALATGYGQLAYDGVWGSVSETGFAQLLSDFGMGGFDPVSHVNEYTVFLDFVMMHGFANRPAGTFRWGDIPEL